jgi:hypothetical protein
LIFTILRRERRFTFNEKSSMPTFPIPSKRLNAAVVIPGSRRTQQSEASRHVALLLSMFPEISMLPCGFIVVLRSAFVQQAVGSTDDAHSAYTVDRSQSSSI